MNDIQQRPHATPVQPFYPPANNDTQGQSFAKILQGATVLLTSGNRTAARQLLFAWKTRAVTIEAYWLLLAHTTATLNEGLAVLEEAAVHLPDAPRLQALQAKLQARLRGTASKRCPFCTTVYPATALVCPSCGGCPNFATPTAWDNHPLLQPDVMEQVIRTHQPSATPDLRRCLLLALAHLNLRAYQAALAPLQAAAKLNPEWPGLQEQIRFVVGRLPKVVERRGKVVVVDDSPTIRRILERQLTELKYEVLTFDDGETAMAQLPQIQPNVILLDVNLPGCDGYRVCSWVKRHPDLKRTAVILLTGEDGFFDKVRGKLAGANRHLGKPYDRDELLQLLVKFTPSNKTPTEAVVE